MRKVVNYILMTTVVTTMGVLMTGCFGPETSKEYTNLENYMMLHYTDNDGNEVVASSNNGNEIAAVLWENEYVTKYAIIKDDEVYFDISGVKEYIDDRFYYDSTENLLMYTDATTVYTSNVGENVVRGEQEETLDYTISVMDGEKCYVNLKFVDKYVDFQYKKVKSTENAPARIIIDTESKTVKNVIAKRNTQIRTDADYMADIVCDVEADKKLVLLESGDEWDKVKSDDGFVGYILSKRVKSSKDSTLEFENDYDTYTHTTLDEKVSLVWHQVMYAESNSTASDVTKKIKGVNVISPTWFKVSDGKGNISSIASEDYVKKMHNEGLQVWALINDFETDKDGNYYVKTVVNNTTARQKLVSNIMKNVALYDLDGINVDFEYINVSEGAGYLQFLRELSIECRKKGVILSVDNYAPAAWTEFYDRNQQGRLADYIIVMNYDEHTSASEEAGSVSSMSFTREGLKNTIDQVGDASRIINGMPFYTRIWCETPEADSDGTGKLIEDSVNGNYYLSTRAVSMDTAKEEYKAVGAEPVWNEETGQNYVYYEKGNSLYMIWLEDQTSVEARLKLIDEFGIGGAAYWKIGLESEDIWQIISNYFQK